MVTDSALLDFDAELQAWMLKERDLGWPHLIEQMSLAVASLAREIGGGGVTFQNEPLAGMNRVRRRHGLTAAEALWLMHDSFAAWFSYPVQAEVAAAEAA